MEQKIKKIIEFIYDATFVLFIFTIASIISLYYLYIQIPEKYRHGLEIEGIHIGKADENISKQ